MISRRRAAGSCLMQECAQLVREVPGPLWPCGLCPSAVTGDEMEIRNSECMLLYCDMNTDLKNDATESFGPNSWCNSVGRPMPCTSQPGARPRYFSSQKCQMRRAIDIPYRNADPRG